MDNKDIKLSDHFTLSEALISQTASRLGIDNIPNDTILAAMRNTAKYMEKVRALLGNNPIHVDSFFRSPELNAAIGGSKTSQHMKGEAVDFICPSFGSCLEIAQEIAKYKDLIPFDQLIMEHSWVHISFVSPNVQPRGQVLSLIKGGHYAPGFTDMEGNPY